MNNQNSYHDSNYNRKYNNNEFFTEMMDNVSIKLKRVLEHSEQKQIISFIKNMDPSLLTPKYKKKSIPIMIETLVKEFSSYKCDEPAYVDSQQIIKKSIGISSESGTSHGIYDDPSYMIKKLAAEQAERRILESADIQQPPPPKPSAITDIGKLLGMGTADEAVRILNPKSQYKRNHILLDSRYRIVDEQAPVNISSFKWNYIQKSQSTAEGSVNIIGNVRDIIGLRIYPFRIPYTDNADNKYSRISLLIQELSAQTFIAHENRKFHFMLTSTIDSEFINLDADVYNGYFWFEKPITTLDTLTISFGNPLEQIIFERDRDFCSFDYFTIAPLTQITTEKNHNLANGDRVYFDNFDVGFVNPILVNQKALNDELKTVINRDSGHLVNVLTPTTFSIPVDSSLIQNPLANLRVRVFFGSKRIFVPIELIYIQPSSD
jgi:hypothetical protein